jgi:hypothetical protein
MSVQAISWALSLPLVSVSQKFTLVCVCNYADKEGRCWPSVDTLAEDSAQSRSTVKRRLHELEELGLLSRLRRRILPGGREAEGGAGKPTSNLLRVRLEILPAEVAGKLITLGQTVQSEPSSGPQTVHPEPSQTVHPDPSGALDGPVDGSGGDPQTVQQTVHSSEPRTLEPRREPRTQDARARDDADGWKEFEQAYPIPITSRAETIELFRTLNPDDQRQAIESARAYRAFVEKQERKAKDAHRWLRSGDWQSFASKEIKPRQERVFVIVGTPAWDAWLKLRGSVPTSQHIVEGKMRTGWWFPSLFPPKPEAQAPPRSELMTAEDERFVKEHGL